MTYSDIIYHRLINQKLAKHNFTKPAEVVSYLGAVQAQDYPAAKWALMQRLNNFTDAELDKAFNEGKILRTHLMRTTWHFVTPEDIMWMLPLTARRVSTAINHQHRELKIDNASWERVIKIFERELCKNNYQTRAALEDIVRKEKVVKKEIRFNYILHRAEAEGIICSGPKHGKQYTYALLNERAPKSLALSKEEALTRLVEKYFVSHGPAMLKDFTWWSGLSLGEAKAGLEAAKRKLSCKVIGGNEFWFSGSLEMKKVEIPQVMLLLNFDEYVVGYKDRGAILDSKQFSRLGPKANAVFHHCLIIDGIIFGIWRRSPKKEKVVLEIASFNKLTDSQKNALEFEAEKYGKFFGKKSELMLKTIK
jgi:hypothetical protein